MTQCIICLFPFWQAPWRREFLKEELIGMKVVKRLCLCHRQGASVPTWLGKAGVPEHQEPGTMLFEQILNEDKKWMSPM